jgi:hypothetical protein
MIRALLVVSLASAGIWLLAGPGWGLITAAVLAYVWWGRLTAFACDLGRVSVGFAVVSRTVRSACRHAPGGIRERLVSR